MFILFWKMKRRNEKQSSILLFLAMLFGMSGLMIALFFVRSMKLSEVDDYLKACGNYDFSFYDVSDKLSDLLDKDSRIQKRGMIWEYSDGVTDKTGQRITLGALRDKETQNLIYIPPTQGHYPKKSNEICMDRLTLKQCGYQAKLGQKIILQIKDKKTAKNIKKTYILSGIIELKGTFADGSSYCTRASCAGYNIDNINGISTGDMIDFPMAYIYFPEAEKYIEQNKVHYFVTLKDIENKKVKEEFIQNYYQNRDLGKDFRYDVAQDNQIRTQIKLQTIYNIANGSYNVSEDTVSDIMENHQGVEDIYTKYLIPFLLLLIGIITATSIYDAVRTSIERKREQHSILLSLGMTGQRLAGGICLEIICFFITALLAGSLLGSWGYQLVLIFLDKMFGIQIPSSFQVNSSLSYYMPYVQEITRSPWILPPVMLSISCIIALLFSVLPLLRSTPLEVEKSKIHKIKRKKERGLYFLLNRYVGRDSHLNQAVPWICIIIMISMGVFGYLFFRCKADYDYRELQEHMEAAGADKFDYYMNRTEDTINPFHIYFEGRHDTGVTKDMYQKLATTKGVKEIHGMTVNRSTALIYQNNSIQAYALHSQSEYENAYDDSIQKKLNKKRYEIMGVKKNEEVFNVPSVGIEKKDLKLLAHEAKKEEIKIYGNLDAEKLMSGEEVALLIKNPHIQSAFQVGDKLPLCDFVLPKDMDENQEIAGGNLPKEKQIAKYAYEVSADGKSLRDWNYYQMKKIKTKIGAIIILNQWEDRLYYEPYQEAQINILTMKDTFEKWGLPDINYTRIGVLLKDITFADSFDSTWQQVVNQARFMTSFEINELKYTTNRGKKNVMAVFYVLILLLIINGLLAVINIVFIRVEKMQTQLNILNSLGMDRMHLVLMYLLRFGKIVFAGAIFSLIPVELFSSLCRWCSRQRNRAIFEMTTEQTQKNNPLIYIIPNYDFTKQPVFFTACIVFFIMLSFLALTIFIKSRDFGKSELTDSKIRR